MDFLSDNAETDALVEASHRLLAGGIASFGRRCFDCGGMLQFDYVLPAGLLNLGGNLEQMNFARKLEFPSTDILPSTTSTVTWFHHWPIASPAPWAICLPF